MVETTTKNYGWVKPEIQHSPATWGGFINDDLDSIDALVFANQQAVSPIGAGALWFAATPPANWLICDGSSLDTTAYADLFAIIGYNFGGSGANFNLPNPLGKMPIGASSTYPLASTGGEAAHVLAAAEIPAHAHPITDVGHTHTATQPAHVHPDPGHTHGVSASQDAHSHGLDHTPMTENVGPNGGAGSGWGFNSTRTDTQQPPVHVSINAAATGLQAAQPAITVAASGTGLSTTQAAGGGGAHNNVPPYLSINFIIRYQ
jgi:microcystin-dependent protein